MKKNYLKKDNKKSTIKENIVLTDTLTINVEEFKNGLEESSKKKFVIYGTKGYNKIKNNKLKSIVKYAMYFIFPLKIFFKRNKINTIVAWQQFYGIIYSFYCNLFKVKKKNDLTIMTFIYKPKKKLKNIYFKFIKYSIDNKYVDNIICFSRNECEYYSEIFNIKREKFKFCPLGLKKAEIKSEYDEKDFIISAGKSNRDYQFLIEALDNKDYKVKIICTTLKHKNTKNIEIYNDVWGERYLAMLKKAFCVVIPLKDENISSGQLVILQAMQFKKPIIVTNSKGIEDYIIDGYNGFIIKKDKQELLNCIEKLKNKNIYEKIVNNAYMDYKEKYTVNELGKNVGKIIKKNQ